MRSTVGLAVVVAVLWACGGSTMPGNGTGDGGSGSSSGGSSSGSGSSSGGSSGGSSSGGTDGGGGGCPSSVPAGGTPCPHVGLACEYGNDPNPACNQIESCTATGWSYATHGPACLPGTCPADYASVPQGKDCSPQGLDCSYPEGQCNCAPTLPASGPNPVWQCSSPGNGCSEPRPRLGSSCAQPGLSCDYGACTDGVAMICQGGVWVQQNTACPV